MGLNLPTVPLPRAEYDIQSFSDEEIEAEAIRLQGAIQQHQRWPLETCRSIAPLTLEINRLKTENDVFLIAHSYQTPDIIYGVADEVADSYTLSKAARDAPQQTILFSSVRFMAETAKIVSPHKTVLHPSPEAGCSLSDGITAQDVRDLRAQYPGVPVACYINTTAAVKAECDVSVTSSNYIRICERLPGDRLIFVPDRFMGAHLQKALAGKKEVVVFDWTLDTTLALPKNVERGGLGSEDCFPFRRVCMPPRARPRAQQIGLSAPTATLPPAGRPRKRLAASALMRHAMSTIQWYSSHK